jgi:hypothetical protein
MTYIGFPKVTPPRLGTLFDFFHLILTGLKGSFSFDFDFDFGREWSRFIR